MFNEQAQKIFIEETENANIKIYNKENDIKISWIYNGREDMTAMNTVGLLFRDLPIGVRLKDEMTLREPVSDEVRDNAQNIEVASKTLLHTINEIMDMSRLETGTCDRSCLQ